MKLKETALLFPFIKNSPVCALVAAGTQISLWCPDILHCSNLPSFAAPLHRAGPHNAQMVAIVLPRPLPRSTKQEALLCMPEGQEAWLTGAEPSEQLKNTHEDTLCLRVSHIVKQTIFLYCFITFCNRQ